MSRRKAPKNPLFEHYSHMAGYYRNRAKNHHESAAEYAGDNPENEGVALRNAALCEEKALEYALLAEKGKPDENPN